MRNNFYTSMTPEERGKRIRRLLIKGIYLYAEERWVKKSEVERNVKTKRTKEPFANLEFKEDKSKISEPKYYTLSEVTEILSITKRTIQRWVKSGKLKTVRKENGHHYVNSENLDFLLM